MEEELRCLWASAGMTAEELQAEFVEWKTVKQQS